MIGDWCSKGVLVTTDEEEDEVTDEMNYFDVVSGSYKAPEGVMVVYIWFPFFRQSILCGLIYIHTYIHTYIYIHRYSFSSLFFCFILNFLYYLCILSL